MTMTVNSGDIIIECEPYVHILSQKERTTICSACVKRCNSLKKCSKCGVLKYCGVTCQREDWRIHKEECQYLQNVSPKIPVDSVMLMLRLIIKQKQNDFGHSGISDEKWNRTFKDFETHKKEIEKDEERMSQFSQIMFTLQKLVPSLPPVNDVFDIFCKMTINSFTICDGELNPVGMTINSFTICDGELNSVGVGIYISPSLIDHSCLPNAVVTFSGKLLSVRALQKIENPSPCNVRISYIDQLALTTDRQEQLYKQYYFTCTCPRCTDTEKDRKMLSVKCPVLNCPVGFIEKEDKNFLSCECGHKFSENELSEILQYEDEIGNSMESLKLEKKMQEPETLLNSCKDCQRRHTKYFHNFNICCTQILDIGLDASVDCGNWSQALCYTKDLIQPYRLYYPSNSPQIGLLLMKQGKIQLYLSMLQEALVSLQDAGGILEVTHGTHHSLYIDLQDLLNQCMEEIRVSLEFSNRSIKEF